MANRELTSQTFKHALLSHRGGSLQSWQKFQELLRYLRDELGKDADTITIGNDTFDRGQFLHFFARFLQIYFVVWPEVGFRPKLQKHAEVVGKLRDYAVRIQSDLQRDTAGLADIILIIKELIDFPDFETRPIEQEKPKSPLETVQIVLERLSVQVADHRQQVRTALRPYLDIHIEGEQDPPEDLAKDEDSEQVAREKKGRRQARAKIVAEYKKTLEKQRKEVQENIAQKNAAALTFILESLQESPTQLAQNVALAVVESIARRGVTAEVSLEIAAQDLIATGPNNIFELVEQALRELTAFHQKTEAEYKNQLGTTVASSVVAPSSEEGGAESEEPRETAQQDVLQQAFEKARSQIRHILTRLDGLNAEEISLMHQFILRELNVREEDVKPDQRALVRDYIQNTLNVLDSFYEEQRTHARQTPEAFIQSVQRLIAPALAAYAAAEKSTEKPETLRSRIQNISVAQQKILIAAENELAYQLQQAGLPPDQVQRILDNNRTLLLDALRYKAIAAAQDLGPSNMGQAQLLSLVAAEVNSFYYKIVGTHPEISGVAAGLSYDTAVNLAGRLRELGLDAQEAANILSNLESSRFRPLLEFAKSNGYLNGGAGLAMVLVQNGLVGEAGAKLMAQRLMNGDFSALLVGLHPTETAALLQQLQEIEQAMQRGGLSEAQAAVYRQRLLQQLSRHIDPNARRALEALLAQYSFDDLYRQMHHLHQILGRTAQGSQRFQPAMGSLRSFAEPPPGDPTALPGPDIDQGLSDEDKFLVEVALATAYERLRDVSPEERAVIEAQIAVMVHEIYFGGEVEPGQMGARLDGALAGAEEPGGILSGRGAKKGNQLFADPAAQQRMNQAFGGTLGRSRSGNQRTQELQAALKLLKTGGNPVAIAGLLLTDKKTRDILMRRLGETVAAAGVGAPAGVMFVINGIVQAISAIPLVGPILGGLVGGLLGISVGGSAAGAGAAATTQVASELARGGLGAGKDALTAGKAEFARWRPGIQESLNNALSQGATSTIKTVYAINAAQGSGIAASIAILTPFILTTFFTLIVITVIGGALNEYPDNNGMPWYKYGAFGQGIAGCWPAEGILKDFIHERDVMKGGSAIDIAAPVGTPIYTPFAGTASYLQNISGGKLVLYGNHVRIKTDQGFDIILAHMSAFPDGISAGDIRPVQAGEIVGFMGSTGKSSGSHVHYEVVPGKGGGTAPHIHTLLPLPVDSLYEGYRTSLNDCAKVQDASASAQLLQRSYVCLR